MSTKVMMYSHDTYGLGHLRRNLAIATALIETIPEVQVLLATGSSIVEKLHRAQRIQLVQLPPVVKVGVDEYRAVEKGMSLSLVRRARSAILIDVVSRWHPDLLLVDHSPQGMKGELLPVFSHIKENGLNTQIVLGLRDIVDNPEYVRTLWEKDGVYETLEEVYDEVLIYGSKAIFDVIANYGIDNKLANKYTYCGYVTNPPNGDSTDIPTTPIGPYLLGTIGGGGDGTEVLKGTLEAAKLLHLGAVIVTGPFMNQRDRRLLDDLLPAYPGAIAVELTNGLGTLAKNAVCVICRGGYNTLAELLYLKVPIVAVPRRWPRAEQVMRVEAFSALGLLQNIASGEDMEISELVSAIKHAISAAKNPTTTIDLEGNVQAVQRINSLITKKVATSEIDSPKRTVLHAEEQCQIG